MYGPDRAVPVLCSQNVATTGEMVIHEGHNNTDHGDDDDYHIHIETFIPTLMGMKPCWRGTHWCTLTVRWTISALYGNT